MPLLGSRFSHLSGLQHGASTRQFPERSGPTQVSQNAASRCPFASRPRGLQTNPAQQPRPNGSPDSGHGWPFARQVQAPLRQSLLKGSLQSTSSQQSWQPPLHSSLPVGQRQTPFWQVVPPVQAGLQVPPPTQAPAEQVCPDGQALPQTPQFAASV
jgi:hypothetical protein